MLAPQSLLLTRVAPVLGGVMANLMFLSPMGAVREVRASGKLGALNAVPLVAMAGNTAAWVGFACVAGDPFIFAANLPGMLLGLWYSVSAIRAAPEATARRLESLLLGYAAVLGVAGFAAAGLAATSGRLLMGMVAKLLSMLYYVAPLSSLANVLSTQCAEQLQWPLAVANGVNGATWAAYGVALNDANVVTPNATGLLLAIMQIGLLAAFGRACSSCRGAGCAVDNEDLGVVVPTRIGAPLAAEPRELAPQIA